MPVTCLTGLIIGNAARARSGSRTVAAPADQG